MLPDFFLFLLKKSILLTIISLLNNDLISPATQLRMDHAEDPEEREDRHPIPLHGPNAMAFYDYYKADVDTLETEGRQNQHADENYDHSIEIERQRNHGYHQ